MLVSIKHQLIQLFSGSDKPKILFSLLVNDKMPTIVGILSLTSRKKFMPLELSMKFFDNLEAYLVTFANSAYPVYMLQNAASGQGHHCLFTGISMQKCS